MANEKIVTCICEATVTITKGHNTKRMKIRREIRMAKCENKERMPADCSLMLEALRIAGETIN